MQPALFKRLVVEFATTECAFKALCPCSHKESAGTHCGIKEGLSTRGQHVTDHGVCNP